MSIQGVNEDASGETQRGKIIRFNFDAYNDLPGDTCLYCLTDRQQMLLIAALEQFGWLRRWYSPSGATITKDAVEEIQAELSAALMSDVCKEIKDILDAIQNTVDDTKSSVDDLVLDNVAIDAALTVITADLATVSTAVGVGFAAVAGIATIATSIQGTVNEMSDDVDNIETIVIASATEITETGADVDNIELLVQKMKNQTTTIINNTTINVAINLPNQTFTSDSSDTTSSEVFARYNAFCAAIEQWVLLEIYAVIEALGGGLTDLATARAVIDADVFYYTYLFTPGAPAFSVATILAAMLDVSAVNDVSCALIGFLANLPPTYENFVGALAAYTPPALPDNRAVLQDALEVAMDGLDAWTGFAPVLAAEYQKQLALNPTDYDCITCGPTSVCALQLWNFAAGVKGPWAIERGKLVYGVGITGSVLPGDDATAVTFSIRLQFPTPCTAIIGHTIRLATRDLPTGTGIPFWAEYYYLLSGVETLYNGNQINGGGTWPAFGFQNSSIPTPPGGAGISSIRIRGNTRYYGTGTAGLTASDIASVEFL